ncbi:MAG: 2'-5' RNA ligase family protein [Cyclobacteriaceae bacterium]|nr:2'-5' RNA ligase family protein [Cyclobacteriaceae bacterium]
MKSEKGNHSLYFIAIIPKEPLQSKLMELKQGVFEAVGSKGALRSPAHITLLMPFKWKPEKEPLLFESLDKLAYSIAPFNIELLNYNCFEPRVVYVDVKNSDTLTRAKNEVVKMARQELKLHFLKDLRGFHPHITIAFRDLKKPQFYTLWERFKEEHFQAQFEASSLALLKHNGKRWDVCKEFQLT